MPLSLCRKRLLGASWETFRTVWVGRFKEIAWSYLEEAVLCAYRDKFSVDPTQARQFFAAIREQGSGGLPDNVLSECHPLAVWHLILFHCCALFAGDLYKTLLKTGDISETSSLYERMCMR